MKTKTREEDDEALKQSNKSHKGLNQKLKKKRKHEKEVKKQKKEKKKENERKKLKKQQRKEKKDTKKDQDGSDGSEAGEGDKLLKYIKKLKVFMEEEADDLFEMFETIDAGGEVCIEELENTKVKNYLKKIFKYLGLKKNSETKEYTKDAETQTGLLKPVIQDLWYKGVETDSSDSDDEKGKGDKMEGEDEEFENNEAAHQNEVDLEQARAALLEGIKDLPHNKPAEEAEEAEEAKEAQVEPQRIKGEEWRSYMDEAFGSMMGEDKKNYSKLRKSGPSAAPGADRSERDKKIDEFMNDYQSQFRKKSLLEEHQERKAQAAAGKQPERRAFDRDLDVTMSRVDSKKIFEMLNNKNNNLGSRFGHSHSGNKYL